MVALVPHEGAEIDPRELARWLDDQRDLGAKWRPTYVRIGESLPTSPTNKILKRTLVHQKYRPDRVGTDALWHRQRDAATFCTFDVAAAEELRQQLAEQGRERFWDL